jgi:membrane protein required for colicin V production
MNWVDIVILVLVVGLGFMGWRNGVIRWVFTLAGFIVGALLAGRMYKDLAPSIPVADSEAVQQLVAFAGIFLVVMIVAWVAARILKTVMSVLLLGWVDSLAGLAVGVITGAFAATAIISAIGIVPSDTLKQAVVDSSLAEPLSTNLSFVRGFLPDEFDQIDKLFELKDSLTEGIDAIQDAADTVQDAADAAQNAGS